MISYVGVSWLDLLELLRFISGEVRVNILHWHSLGKHGHWRCFELRWQILLSDVARVRLWNRYMRSRLHLSAKWLSYLCNPWSHVLLQLRAWLTKDSIDRWVFENLLAGEILNFSDWYGFFCLEKHDSLSFSLLFVFPLLLVPFFRFLYCF